MGADFLLTYIPYPKMTDERRKDIDAIINALTFEDVEGCAYHLNWDDYDDDDECLDAIKSRLNEIFDSYEYMAKFRTTNVCRIRGSEYLFAGGMSWGDSPSGVFDDITAIVIIEPLYKQLNTWALEKTETSVNNV